jgi:hypothetical protein
MVQPKSFASAVTIPVPGRLHWPDSPSPPLQNLCDRPKVAEIGLSPRSIPDLTIFPFIAASVSLDSEAALFIA